jgi:hypothetical protein
MQIARLALFVVNAKMGCAGEREGERHRSWFGQRPRVNRDTILAEDLFEGMTSEPQFGSDRFKLLGCFDHTVSPGVAAMLHNTAR